MRNQVSAWGPDNFVTVASSEEDCPNLLIPCDEPTLTFNLGAGSRGKRTQPQKNKVEVGLPFGLSLPKIEKPARKRANDMEEADQKMKGDGAKRKKKGVLPAAAVDDHGDDDDDGKSLDCLEMAMKPRHLQEWEGAMAEEEEAQADAADQPTNTVVDAQTQAGEVGGNQTERNAAKTAQSRKGVKGSSFFHHDLGITGSKLVSRKGMVCLHCNASLEKGSVRFALAYNAKKPERSIHTECLTQISPEQLPFSIRTLEALLETGSGVEQKVRQSCQDALATLRQLAACQVR